MIVNRFETETGGEEKELHNISDEIVNMNDDSLMMTASPHADYKREEGGWGSIANEKAREM